MTPYWTSSDGRHVIYNDDCRNVLPTLEPFDLVLTDPPYSHNHIDGGGFASARAFYREGALDGLNDFILSDYADHLIGAAPMMVAFHSRDLVPDYAALSRTCGRKYDLHLWWKTNAIPFTANTWKSDVEYIALIWDRKPGWTQCRQDVHSKVWASPINRDDSHPAAKPIDLLQKYIRVLSPETVCDPFMGGATCAIACEREGKRFVGIETSERYCEESARRIEEAMQTLWRKDEPKDVQLELPT